MCCRYASVSSTGRCYFWLLVPMFIYEGRLPVPRMASQCMLQECKSEGIFPRKRSSEGVSEGGKHPNLSAVTEK